MLRAFEAPYVNRALAGALACATDPIVVLEGPCGAGKTSLVRNEPVLHGFHYVSLADDAVFSRAVREPLAWVASLPQPIIIDDAHRVDSLVETVQRLLAERDEQVHAAPSFILVGSRSLLGGERKRARAAVSDSGVGQSSAKEEVQDENVREAPRVRRLNLFPLTQAELHEREGCIVDDLFDRDPLPDFHSAFMRSDLRTMMRIGGFPRYAAHPICAKPQERSIEVQEGMRTMLHEDTASVADIDRSIERAILKKVLENPGLCLGAGTLARACYVDIPTVLGHIDTFADRYLVHPLAGFGPGADGRHVRGTRGVKTRLYPLDTTFVIEACRALGRDIAVEPSVFGKVLRTLCVNQLIPAAQWAAEPTECRYWWKYDRRARTVDLVLCREDRLVGVKVRNCGTVHGDAIGALKFLAEDERFAKGYVIYTGSNTVQLAENIWAIPVSALWEREAFYPKPVEDDTADEGYPEDPEDLEEMADIAEGMVR